MHTLYGTEPSPSTIVSLPRHFLQATISFLHARIQEFSSRGGGGGPGQSDKKSSDFFFFFFFIVLSLFNRSQMVNFEEIYHFSRFQRASNIFQGGGGPTFTRGGGVQLLIPYRNPYNL